MVLLSPTGYPEGYRPISRKPEVFEDEKLKGAKKLSQATQSVQPEMLERQKQNNEEKCQLLKKETFSQPPSTDEVVSPFMLPAKMNSKYLRYEEMNSHATDSNTKEAENF